MEYLIGGGIAFAVIAAALLAFHYLGGSAKIKADEVTALVEANRIARAADRETTKALASLLASRSVDLQAQQEQLVKDQQTLAALKANALNA